MELALAIPLGLLLSGSLESYKRPLYAFAAVVMAMSLRPPTLVAELSASAPRSFLWC
jgi:urea transporter